jgi:hypothetical protein
LSEAEEISFLVESPESTGGGVTLSRCIGEAVEEHLRSGARGTVISACLNFITTKTSPVIGLQLRRSDGKEGNILSALLLWIRASGVRNKDPLLTRYIITRRGWTRYVLRRKDYAELLKMAASEVGLPVARYSYKSLRVGVASLSGMGGEQKDRICGWKAGSGVRQSHYDHRPATGRAEFEDNSEATQTITLGSLLQKAAAGGIGEPAGV